MKNLDLLKLIKKDGWKYSYSTGGHDHYLHPTKSGKVTCLRPSLRRSCTEDAEQYPEAGRFAMTRQYPVVYEWAGKNFSGYAPDVAGCIATAKSLLKIRSMLKGALEAHLQWLQNDGDLIPAASPIVTVDLQNDLEFPNPPGYYVVVETLEIDLPKKKRTSPRKPASRELTAA